MSKYTRHRYEIPVEKIKEISRLLEAASVDIVELDKIIRALSAAMVEEDNKSAREELSESIKLVTVQSGATQKTHHAVQETAKICLELHEIAIKSHDYLYESIRELRAAQKEFSKREQDFIEVVDLHNAAKNGVKTFSYIRKIAVWTVSVIASIGALLALAAKVKGG